MRVTITRTPGTNSGYPATLKEGDVIDVDAKEAEKLISAGLAEPTIQGVPDGDAAQRFRDVKSAQNEVAAAKTALELAEQKAKQAEEQAAEAAKAAEEKAAAEKKHAAEQQKMRTAEEATNETKAYAATEKGRK